MVNVLFHRALPSITYSICNCVINRNVTGANKWEWLKSKGGGGDVERAATGGEDEKNDRAK